MRDTGNRYLHWRHYNFLYSPRAMCVISCILYLLLHCAFHQAIFIEDWISSQFGRQWSQSGGFSVYVNSEALNNKIFRSGIRSLNWLHRWAILRVK